MAASPSLAQQLAASDSTTVKAMNKNATSKQYNLKLSLVIKETNNDKAFFDSGIDYTGVPYGFVVVVEAAMVELLGKLTQLGGEIATAGETPPAP